MHDLIYDLCAADGVARPHRVAAMLLELAGGTCLLATAKNIEEEEQALEELRLAEQRFATAFRSSPEAMTIATLPDARILEANPSFLELSGYPYDEVIGRTALELGIWEDPEERARLFGALTEGRPVRDVELRFRRRDGERLWTRFSLSLVELDGELCILPMGRDITPMRRLEEEREALIRKLEMRRAELGQFSYSISHDLRTPMVTISGFLGMLERHAAEGDRPAMHRDLDHLRSAANHLGALLDDLRDLSEAGRGLGEITEVDLGALARESIIALERRLERRAVEVEISTDLPKVRGDRRRLRQVFDHLLSNAIKFLGEQEHPRIEIGARAAPGGGGRAEVYVRDNGVGIAPRYQEKIFGLFQRLDPSVEGTGLGLALVARLIELHGGGIRAESAGLGHGSTMIWTVDGSNHRISGDVPRGEG